MVNATSISSDNSVSTVAGIVARAEYSLDEIEQLLAIEDPAGMERLFSEALEVTKRNVGETIYFRGIVEFSNRCAKNCFYCGIRRDNQHFKRFFISEAEIMECASWAADR